MLKMSIALPLTIIAAIGIAQAPEGQPSAPTPRPGLRIFRVNQPAAAPAQAAPDAPAGQPAIPPAPAERSAPPAQTREGAARRTRAAPAPERSAATGRAETRTARTRDTSEKTDKTAKQATKPATTSSTQTAKKSATELELQRSADEATSAVSEFLASANKGVYSRAGAYLTPQVQKFYDGDAGIARGGLKAAMDELTREGDILRWTLKATVRGEGGRVNATIEYRSGQSERRTFDLLKIDGKWRIFFAPGVMPSGPAAALPSPAASSNAAASESAPVALAPLSAKPVSEYAITNPPDQTPVPAPAPPPVATPAPTPAPSPSPAVSLPEPAKPPPVSDAAKTPDNTPKPPDTAQTSKSALSDAPWQMQVAPGDIIKVKP
ncbi:MAG: hypothetical protein NTY46_07975 [Candidatus Sumerlaeota bacterium]|nr:hypothetical protein [Candidatus Sumerlaeota bacterium]